MCTVCDIDMGIRESWLAFYNLYLGSGWVAGLRRPWHWWPAVSWSLWRHFNVWCFELSELSWWLLADNVDSRGEMVSQATGHWAHVSVSPPSHPAFYFPFCVISQPAPGRCSVVAAESANYKIQDVSDNVWNLWRDLRPACCNHSKYRKFKCSWQKRNTCPSCPSVWVRAIHQLESKCNYFMASIYNLQKPWTIQQAWNLRDSRALSLLSFMRWP